MSGQLAAPRPVVKFASLAVDLAAGQGRFQPWAPTATYRAEQAAVCARGARHVVPDLDCTCGFYGTDTLAQLMDLVQPSVGDLAGSALLDAELGGVELAGPFGVRAAEQRVLAAAVLRWCPLCTVDEALPMVPAGLFALPTPGGGFCDVVALCEGHAVLSEHARELSLADLCGLLRTDVRWASSKVHEDLLRYTERRWSTGQIRGPLAADRQVRHLRMGHLGFTPVTALRLNLERGELWIDERAPAPQRPARDFTVGIKKRLGPGYELLVTSDRTARVEQYLHDTARPPHLGTPEGRIEQVWGLRRMQRLSHTLHPAKSVLRNRPSSHIQGGHR